MGWLSLLFFILGAAAFYWFFVRPELKKRPAFAEFYQKTDSFWVALGMKLNSLKTKLSGWFVVIAGALVELHDYVLPFVTGIDFGSVTDTVPMWVWPVLGTGLGVLFTWLNSVTKAKQERELSAVATGASIAEAKVVAEVTATPAEAALVVIEEKPEVVAAAKAM